MSHGVLITCLIGSFALGYVTRPMVRFFSNQLDAADKAILLLLDRRASCYSLEILDALHLGMSAYGRLWALETRRLIESEDKEEAMAERGGRPRRYYRLTDTGRMMLYRGGLRVSSD